MTASRQPGLAVCAGALLLLVGCGGGDSSGGTLPPTPTVTLLDVQTQVFSVSCSAAECHSGSTPPFGLDLSSVSASSASLTGVFSGEVPGLLRVDPFNPEGSYLYMKLTGATGIQGDPMPLGGGPLGAGDLALVESWIDQGAR